MTKMKRVRVHKEPDALDAYIVGRINALKAKEMTVSFDPEPISYEALDERLIEAYRKATRIHHIIWVAGQQLERDHEGGDINVFMRELEVLESTLEVGLRYAESVADQIKSEVE